MLEAEKAYLEFWEKNAHSTKTRNVTINGIEIEVPPGVFNPDPKLTHSSSMIINHMGDNKGLEVLDLCCGSGILSVFALRNGARRVVATDIDERAVECTRKNLSNHRFDNKSKVVQGDLFENVEGKFDRIYANLPIAGAGAKDIYEQVLGSYFQFLNNEGELHISFASFAEMDLNQIVSNKIYVKHRINVECFEVKWSLLIL